MSLAVHSPDAHPQEAQYFCVTMPPPNVTGSLHLGHALNMTLQDALVRYHRLKGFHVLWQPGIDHAGIATQMLVEKHLKTQGYNNPREEIDRDAFLGHIWAWKNEYGHRIIEQLKKLHISADWSRTAFTLDEHPQEAVRHAFVDLYRRGLIYKGKRMVSVDTTLQTVVSDLERTAQDTQGHLWTIRYFIVSSNLQEEHHNLDDILYVDVATSRPETLFADQAIAVHPDDERYRDVVGRYVRVPLTNRVIPIIADAFVEPAKGTGAVKITPGHDPYDFACGQRHNLFCPVMFDWKGRITKNADNLEIPEKFLELDRYVARAMVVQDLKENGHWISTQDVTQVVYVGDRSGTVLEPMVTEQWFLNTKELAEDALAAVKSNDVMAEDTIHFHPQDWVKTYQHFLSHIEPWCLSRQIVWGHRIPAWYGPDGRIFVAHSYEDALLEAQNVYGQQSDGDLLNTIILQQDSDVLDTWFSSALWPFSTLGWPHDTADLQNFYPTNVLVTGFDIIFFWVARMIMMSLGLTKKVPFHHVLIHGLVCDAKGQKMSKTRGNVIDPMHMIDSYSSCALRLSFLMHSFTLQKVHFSEQNVVAARDFLTKFRNAARFFLSFYHGNSVKSGCALPDASLLHPVNQWIIQRLHAREDTWHKAYGVYNITEATQDFYRFFWNDVCDLYIEMLKVVRGASDTLCADEHWSVISYMMKRLCMWLSLAAPETAYAIAAELNIGVIEDLRFDSTKSAQEYKNVTMIDDTWALVRFIRRFFKRSERTIEIIMREPNVLIIGLLKGYNLKLSTNDQLDKPWILRNCAEEKHHIEQEIQKAQEDLSKITALLNNDGFRQKASANIIDEKRQRIDEIARNIHAMQYLMAALG